MVQVGPPMVWPGWQYWVGKAFPKSSQGGQGHHRIPDPVGLLQNLLIGILKKERGSYCPFFMLLGTTRWHLGRVQYIEFLTAWLGVPGVVAGSVSMWGLSMLAANGLNWEPAIMFF